MSFGLLLKDLAVWMGETCGGGPERPPRRALGVREGAPVLLRWSGSGYEVERPAGPGDAAPIFLSEDQALGVEFEIGLEAALHGEDAARLEAAKRCPFPLESAEWRLARAPRAWRGGAPWRLAAAQKSRLSGLRGAIAEVGAKGGAPFAVIDGASAPLTARKRIGGLSVFAAAALVAAVAAVVSVEIGVGRIEAAAKARLADARASLDQAEAEASAAASRREAEAAPIRAAIAGDALLAAAPPAGRALAALTAAMDDAAHARRVRIAPGSVEAEIAAPDAAALAQAIGAADAFASARLKTAAQVDAATGLQRAVLDIVMAAPR